MPIGKRLRVTGALLTAPRGYVIELDDGGVYVLDTGREAAKLVGQRVTVEGTRSGFDRIDADWIGPADGGPRAV